MKTITALGTAALSLLTAGMAAPAYAAPAEQPTLSGVRDMAGDTVGGVAGDLPRALGDAKLPEVRQRVSVSVPEVQLEHPPLNS
ncbi:hypothetical protein [Streptomyces sp. ODS28]|uniref:hypothetical protein n=1 Tax=Streptomyces sp. ODS28 TaxID=3136688 RepID=UPI0031EAA4D7